MWLTLLIFFATATVAGTNTAILKFSVLSLDPLLVYALRFSLASLILLPFVLFKKPAFDRTHIVPLLLSSLMFAVSILLATYSLVYTSVTMHQIIWIPQSLVVAVGAFLILREKLNKNHVVGLLFAITGASILLSQIIGSADTVTFGTTLGNFLSILAFICSCFFVIFSRKSSRFYPPLVITFANFLTAAFLSLVLVPFALASADFNQIVISPSAVYAIISLALFSSVAVYYLYQVLVKRTLAFIVTLTNYVSMIFALILGKVFYGESLGSVSLLGIALIILGVIFATSSKDLVNFARKMYFRKN